MTKERKRFEQWWDAEDDIPNDGPYTPDTPIQFAWAGWQAALAEQEKEQEPVACMVENDDYGVMVWPIEHINEAGTYCEENEFPVLLYATPPQRKPLTDDELSDIWFKQSTDWMEFARAIEAKLKEKNNG